MLPDLAPTAEAARRLRSAPLGLPAMPLMPPTAELRWFFTGPIPREIRAWFRRDGEPTRERSRTDEYLRLPTTSVGIKFRGGTLEIKPIVEDYGVRTCAGVSGRMQRWVKWSYSEADVAALRRRVVADRSLCVPVKKRRSLRKFSCDQGVREVRPDAKRLPDDGCNAELTEIAVAKDRYWTFGFESFGFAHPNRVADFLRATAERLLADPHRPTHFRTRQSAADSFTVASSLSYPEWLMTLSDPSGRSLRELAKEVVAVLPARRVK